MKIVGIGESVLDIIFRDGQPRAAVPGGSTFNSMVSLGRTVGVKYPSISIDMVTQIGRDSVSEIVTAFMLDNHLRTDMVRQVEGRQSTISMAMLGSSNDAQYEFFRDADMPPFDSDEVEWHRDDIVLFGSYFAISPESRERTRELVRGAHEAGAIVYYDINFRRNHISELPTFREYIESNCAMSDIVHASAEDLQYLFGDPDPQRAYERHFSEHCQTFICTKGADEVVAYSGDQRVMVPVERIETVSTIGAGDNFNAGLIYGLVRDHICRDDLTTLDLGMWQRLIRTAISFSADVCQSMDNYVDTDFINRI